MVKNKFCNSGGTCHWNWILCTAKTGSYLLKVIAAPWTCIKVQKSTHDMYNMNVLDLVFHPVWDSNKISKSLGVARISDRWRSVVEIHLHPHNSRFCVVFYTRLSVWSHWAHGECRSRQQRDRAKWKMVNFNEFQGGIAELPVEPRRCTTLPSMTRRELHLQDYL